MKKILLLILALLSMALQSQNKIESSLEEVSIGTSWEKDWGTDFEYDVNNNLISETLYKWEPSGWKLEIKRSYTYNSANKLTEILIQYWEGGQFSDVYKHIFTYNLSGQIVELLSEEWDEFGNSSVIKTEYFHNNSLLSYWISYVQNGSEWINYQRSTFSYTGILIQESVLEDWDETQWDIKSRTLVTYNANNKVTSIATENWDGSIWTEFSRNNFELDANGNRLTDVTIDKGSIQSKKEYSYDFTVPMSNFAHPFKDKIGAGYFEDVMPYYNKLLSYEYSVSTGEAGVYQIRSRTIYNYNSSLLNTNDLKMSHLKISPNPSGDFITIAGLKKQEKIIIYNISGAKVLEKNIAAAETIDIRSLSSGLYIIRLENGQSLKFIKK